MRSGVNSERPEWLAEIYAFTTLPSASSFGALRTFAKDIQAEKPFIGFSDPVFSGTEAYNQGASQYAANRGFKAVPKQQEPVTPRLPETAGKLEVISMAPGNTIDTLYLGNNATEARIKKSLP